MIYFKQLNEATEMKLNVVSLDQKSPDFCVVLVSSAVIHLCSLFPQVQVKDLA